MKVILDERQRAHDPQFRLENGQIVLNPDRPERVSMLLKGALDAGCEHERSSDHGIALIGAVHAPRYIHYLRTIFNASRQALPDIVEVVPSRFCADPLADYSSNTEAMIGFHNSDTSCPISEQSWDSIYWSAQTALTGASRILAGDTAVYALSRPSGHHAYREMSGGFCFLNNSAIAAEYLRLRGHRPAILDIDVHHGNGTQAIFYHRDDVLTLSIHVDPASFYPYYAGASGETGEGRGEGFNLNLPLPQGANVELYLVALTQALQRIHDFGATAIVVALGLDAHEQDPFRGMSLTTRDFARIALSIRSLGLPVLNVQEGGYMQPCLGENLQSYLRSFL
ncbi:histone deacetylase family protein [Ensifer sp. ENS06]|uniref:histone deacetylase family protein n=1 Tax=Ensifer sp. ENS06 TaxID=2769276 RepID=UPI00177A8A45|nr:histone deacetylase family protein [Ensifer sp. ENS06]MBD9626967.1 histone deacetylase family protein [Ensifer sp. ENS06]